MTIPTPERQIPFDLFGATSENAYICTRKSYLKEKRMAASTYKKRTREEIVAWLDRARQRKEAWERETELELKAMMAESRRAKESHYFEVIPS